MNCTNIRPLRVSVYHTLARVPSARCFSDSKKDSMVSLLRYLRRHSNGSFSLLETSAKYPWYLLASLIALLLAVTVILLPHFFNVKYLCAFSCAAGESSSTGVPLSRRVFSSYRSSFCKKDCHTIF